MNQAHLQLSMSTTQGFYESGDPYIVALDTVNSFYGTGEKSFYYNERTFTIEVAATDMARSFYLSGKVWVRNRQIFYDASDGLDLAIRLDEPFDGNPYDAFAFGQYDALYSNGVNNLGETVSLNSFGFMPSYEININTVLTVPAEKEAIIYFLASPLRPVFEEGEVFVIDGAKLSCIQVEDYMPLEGAC